jgi:hypothetical protein
MFAFVLQKYIYGRGFMQKSNETKNNKKTKLSNRGKRK